MSTSLLGGREENGYKVTSNKVKFAFTKKTVKAKAVTKTITVKVK